MCGLLSSLPRGAQHLHVLGMPPVDGQSSTGSLPWSPSSQSHRCKGNPSGKWEKSQGLEEGDQGHGHQSSQGDFSMCCSVRDCHSQSMGEGQGHWDHGTASLHPWGLPAGQEGRREPRLWDTAGASHLFLEHFHHPGRQENASISWADHNGKEKQKTKTKKQWKKQEGCVQCLIE